jgi:energy-coupling factor transporter ATP-binding protein EcfA2
MLVTRVKLANLRAIETAEFSFKPGFNLIVGVNGVGKSTVLDALRVCMSRVLPAVTDSRAKTMSFSIDDIQIGFPFLDVTTVFSLAGNDFRFTRRQWRERVAADDETNLQRLRREILESPRLRDRARNLLRELEGSHGVSDTDAFSHPRDELRRAAEGEEAPPLCIYFSTNRSLVAGLAPARGKTAGGIAAAYAEALSPRSWQLRQFAEWMRAQAALALERPEAAHHLEALRTAATKFLPSYDGVRPDADGGTRLLIDRSGVTLEIGQLSDGERGVLAMVLDLARRLSQANPGLEDPLQRGSAIVLIDELDLHLHPAWQRQVVHKLVDVFPRCQFIATTHSPQVIGEVEHDRIQILTKGQVYSPTHSFGVDSSRVLEEIMEADPRTHNIQALLARLAKDVAGERINDARKLVDELAARLGEADPEVTRARTLLDFMDGDE